MRDRGEGGGGGFGGVVSNKTKEGGEEEGPNLPKLKAISRICL